MAWAGMRGVVSLASALSVPLLLDDGSAFPQRDLVLFITFAVILCTLVLQGLSLPLLIRWLRFEAPEEHADDRRLREEQAMTRHLAAAALEHLDAQRGGPTRRVLLTPQGVPFTQRTAERLATYPALTLICGRYEGFDERIRSHVDEEISLGDFVLLGGEIAALAVIEATARLLPGVLGNERSATDESHASFLLEYPQYTRPPEFRGQGIPDILMSGHHAKIEAWRRRESVKRTLQRRPDLLEGRTLDKDLAKLVASVKAELAQLAEASSDPSGEGPS